ncbi:unnamed protein product [Dibothriocephalus latus]|uniref:Uncharacterized protein n=1 Tax=Dibothriocephalus latus TaxID=60516 RepID=A0A3P7L128_DIBLA|nr:unnamed protein product [Dibothriocephalus latus]
MIAVRSDNLCGVRRLPVDLRFHVAVGSSHDEYLEEGQLLILYFFPSEFYIWDHRVEGTTENLQRVSSDDNERVVNVTTTKDQGL